MKKWLLVLMLCFIVGCSGGNSSNGNTVAESAAFIGGEQGIVMSFEPEQPPSEVFDSGNTPFGIGLRLENQGEWSVETGEARVDINGISPEAFGVTAGDLEQVSVEPLFAKSKDLQGNVLDGGVSVLSFDSLNFGGSLSGNNEFNVRADLCYSYGTQAVTSVCVKEDLLSPGGVCTVSGARDVANSGAPIQIENVRESAAGADKITITFDVVHKGTGDVYKLNSNCQKEVQDENVVKVLIKTNIPGVEAECSGFRDVDGNPLTNTNEGYVALSRTDGKKTMNCATDVSQAASDFEQLVDIEVEYDYGQFITTPLLVKSLG